MLVLVIGQFRTSNIAICVSLVFPYLCDLRCLLTSHKSCCFLFSNISFNTLRSNRDQDEGADLDADVENETESKGKKKKKKKHGNLL